MGSEMCIRDRANASAVIDFPQPGGPQNSNLDRTFNPCRLSVSPRLYSSARPERIPVFSELRMMSWLALFGSMISIILATGDDVFILSGISEGVFLGDLLVDFALDFGALVLFEEVRVALFFLVGLLVEVSFIRVWLA